MKFYKMILSTLNNCIHNKKNVIIVLILTIIFSLNLFIMSLNSSLNNYWHNSITKLVDYRSFIVTFDETKYTMSSAINELKENEHVVEAYGMDSYLISMSVRNEDIVKGDNGILLVGTISNPIKLYSGQTLDNFSDNDNPIICAKQFYPYTESNQKDYVTSKSIDISDKLGNNIDLSFITSNTKEKFKLVGLYDAEENHTEGNVCYTKTNVVKKLNDKYQYNVFNQEGIINNTMVVVLDNLESKEEIANIFSKKGFCIVAPVLKINKDLGNKIIKILQIAFLIFVIMSIGIIILSFSKKNKHSIMKANRFSNHKIIKFNFIEIVFEIINACLLSIIIYFVLVSLFQQFYVATKIVFYDLKININWYAILLNFLLGCLINIILCIPFFKNKTM